MCSDASGEKRRLALWSAREIGTAGGIAGVSLDREVTPTIQTIPSHTRTLASHTRTLGVLY